MSRATPLDTRSNLWGAELPRSRAYCREVARRAGNFFFAMRLVPEPKRAAMYALYAWMRQADDIADGSGQPQEKLARLRQFWSATQDVLLDRNVHASPASLWPAFHEAAFRYQLSAATLHEHVTGQMLDQQKTRYATLVELHDYCRRVASTVGLLCVQIWGEDGHPRVRELTEWRGVALQLTNVARDVVEDARLGRVYLPDELTGRPLSREQILTGADEAVRAVAALTREAASFYERSAPLEGHIHPEGRASLRAMTRIYRGVLERIERDPHSVLRGRVSLPAWRKAWIALSAVMG